MWPGATNHATLDVTHTARERETRERERGSFPNRVLGVVNLSMNGVQASVTLDEIRCPSSVATLEARLVDE